MQTDEHDRRFDDLLDNALRHYGAAEPRPGLERRLLARLRAEQSRPALTWRSRWLYASVAALAALVLASLVLPHTHRRAAAPASNAKVVSAPASVLTPAPQRIVRPRPVPNSRSKSRVVPAPVHPPKRDRFPSPAPLSEQEQMLAAYVSQYPREASATAHAQTSLFKQEEEERAALTVSNQR